MLYVVYLLNLRRVEENVLITCACIPTLGPFITYLREKDLSAAFRAITQIRSTRGHSDHIALRDYGSVGKLTDTTTKAGSVRQDDDGMERGFNQ